MGRSFYAPNRPPAPQTFLSQPCAIFRPCLHLSNLHPFFFVSADTPWVFLSLSAYHCFNFLFFSLAPTSPFPGPNEAAPPTSFFGSLSLPGLNFSFSFLPTADGCPYSAFPVPLFIPRFLPDVGCHRVVSPWWFGCVFPVLSLVLPLYFPPTSSTFYGRGGFSFPPVWSPWHIFFPLFLRA